MDADGNGLIYAAQFSMRMINVLYLSVAKPKSQAEEKSSFFDKLGCLTPYRHDLIPVFTSFYWELCFYVIISIDIISLSIYHELANLCLYIGCVCSKHGANDSGAYGNMSMGDSKTRKKTIEKDENFTNKLKQA